MIPPRLFFPEGDSSAPPKFEDLLARLEEIVSDMENADLPLEKLLGNYEEGMQLVKACGDRLADAEQKVEILSKAISSDPAKPVTNNAEPLPIKTDEDITLF